MIHLGLHIEDNVTRHVHWFIHSLSCSVRSSTCLRLLRGLTVYTDLTQKRNLREVHHICDTWYTRYCDIWNSAISSITCPEIFELGYIITNGLSTYDWQSSALMASICHFLLFLQVVSAIPVHLDGKSAPGQVPTGSVCYERNGVSGMDNSMLD